MIVPALVLLAARMLFHERIAPILARAEAWITRNSREAMAWVAFLLGFYLVGDASGALGLD